MRNILNQPPSNRTFQKKIPPIKSKSKKQILLPPQLQRNQYPTVTVSKRFPKKEPLSFQLSTPIKIKINNPPPSLSNNTTSSTTPTEPNQNPSRNPRREDSSSRIRTRFNFTFRSARLGKRCNGTLPIGFYFEWSER